MHDSQITPNALFQPTLPDHLQSVLDDITARNRSRFAGWSMEGTGGDGGGSGDGGGDSGGSGDGDGDGGGAGDGGGSGDAGKGDQGGDSGKAKGKDGDKGGDDPQDVSALPEWAQKLIKDTRDEAAKHRTGKTAAEQKYQETLDTIAKGLGLKDDEEPDAAKLTSELTEAQQARRDTAAELVVWRHAKDLGVDPQAVTDSRAFERAIKDLDPTDAGAFAEAVKKAAQEAAEQNPKLKAAPAAGKGGAELNGGSGEGANKDKPKTLGDAVKQHYDA